jgi:hypothetical protein
VIPKKRTGKERVGCAGVCRVGPWDEEVDPVKVSFSFSFSLFFLYFLFYLLFSNFEFHLDSNKLNHKCTKV